MQTLWEQFLELLRTDPNFRAEVRRLILTEELLSLPAKLDELAKIVRELTETVREHSEILRRHEEILSRHEEILREHTEILRHHSEQLAALIDAQRRTEEQIATLVEVQRRTWEEAQRLAKWQRGEAGRREGEEYERQVVRRAPAIFNRGQGGPPDQPLVQKRLTKLLEPLWREGLLDPEDDPLLADLIWWKGDRMVVVEASLKVNGRDIERAKRRAETLRKAGADAVGVVVGKEWAGKAKKKAITLGVEWLIGSEMSDGFREFRRIK